MGQALARLFSGGSGASNEVIVLRGRKLVVVKHLADGGFSSVFHVRDIACRVAGSGAATKENFALKKMLLQLDEQEDLFVAEVANHRRLQHPNVCPILDSVVRVGRAGRKEGLILLPLYEKGSMQDLINTGSTDLGQLIKIFVGACRGVEAFHRLAEPYAVRDVKPANIMISAEGTGILIDLGSAEPARIKINNRREDCRARHQAIALQERAAGTVTGHATLRRAAPYRPPELFQVHSDAVLDERSDVFSLGCTLYAGLYHEPPFDGSETAAVSGRYPIPNTPEYPHFILDLVARMLAIDPATRPSVSEIIRILQAAPL